MKNVLILADGEIAKHFVQWVGKSRIDDNHYYIICNKEPSFLKEEPNLTFIQKDPTSYLRLSHIMKGIEFAVAFIVMENKEEGIAIYRNIRLLEPKLRIVFSSKWDDLSIKDDNIKIININELMASSLYEELPNVPIIAKNIGLGQGEIMEVLVPFGSSYAYRHIGAVSYRKWRIILIYRNDKQIFPNSATMIKPNDRLIIAGNPSVLEEVYKTITQRRKLFPEPFGKNLYLIIDMQRVDKEDIIIELNEATFMARQFVDSKLYIRILNGSMNILRFLKESDKDSVYLLSNYKEKKEGDFLKIIEYDMTEYHIGLFLLNNQIFKKDFQKRLYILKRPVYIFGESSLYNISEAIIFITDEVQMESLSSSAFDICESLNLKLTLYNYDPEGDFSEKKNIIEHYETLANLHNFKIEIKEKRANPIKELRELNDVLHIIPFDKSIMNRPIANFFSQNISRYFLGIKKHPKILIPIED